MRIEDLAKPPFNLDAPAISWVRQTLGRLSPDDRLRHLFNLLSVGDDPETIARVQTFRPGGITRMRGGDIAHERAVIDDFNVKAQVPLLVSADLEGSRMSLAGGAEWPNPLALAAIDDLDVTETVSRMMVEEARAAGINWSFTPVLDINAAWRSPIVSTRGFGSDPEVIARHALTQMRVFQRHGIASAVKHWPGEGHDDRDQHLGDHDQPAVDGRLGSELRPALPRRDRGRGDVGDVGAYRAARLRARAGGGWCGRGSVPAGLDQPNSQRRPAAQAARLQRVDRLGRHGHGRARGLVEALGASAGNHCIGLRCHSVFE
jgi:hypothetical protein